MVPESVSTSLGHQPSVLQWLLLCSLLAIALLIPCAAQLASHDNICAAACMNGGHCNLEEKRCECKLGFKGSSCDINVLSGCFSSNHSQALASYNLEAPKSCECWKQLQAEFRNPEGSRMDWRLWVMEYQWSARVCYEREGLPKELQFSDPPSENETGIIWRFPESHGEIKAPPDGLRFGHQLFAVPAVRQPKALPLSQCPERCNDRGFCISVMEGDIFAHPKCKCMMGLAGSSCELVDHNVQACLNNCSGHGECQAGFCACQAGWFGMDCSRSKAFPSALNTTIPPSPGFTNGLETLRSRIASRQKINIYRYELPWHLAFPYGYGDGLTSFGGLYSAFQLFFDMFSSDWVHRTEDPWEADLYYVPLLVNVQAGNTGDVYDNVKRVLAYIAEQYPLTWGRHQGKDHFLWLPGDRGACWLLDEPLVQNPIKIVHFGLQIPLSQYDASLPGHRLAAGWSLPAEYSCVNFSKDVVAPAFAPNADELHLVSSTFQEALNHGVRRHLLYFGGAIRLEQPEYSGGARQAFYRHIVEAGANATPEEVQYGGGHNFFRESNFCYVPYGDGWGNRLFHAVLGACIPVIVQDHVHQPFEDFLDYNTFSIRISVSEVPCLLDKLRGISMTQVLSYRQALHKHYRALIWQPEFHGLAYNFTLRSLRRRLSNNMLGGHIPQGHVP